jgi:hypothetical protein
MIRSTSARFAWLASLASVIVAVVALAAPAAAQTVSDSTFLDTDWSLTQFTTPGGGTSTATQSLSGGNPGAFRNVTDALNAAGGPTVNGIVLSTSIYTPFTYNPGISGAISSLAYSEDAACISGCFGQGQSTGPAVQQGGSLYILNSSVITGASSTWTNHALSGLTSADFALVNVAADGSSYFDNTQHPNFSGGGGAIQFGFFRANGTSLGGGGYTLAAGIDNWQITINAAPPPPPVVLTPVPTLTEWALAALALGVALIGFACRRRLR